MAGGLYLAVLQSLRVVPARVQIRLACYLMAAGLGFWCLTLALRGSAFKLWWFALPLMSLGLYLAWCLLPDWHWGLGDSLEVLPVQDGQRVLLSFDDGPTPGLTGEILSILSEKRIRASFFVLVNKARRHPELIRRIVADGHLLGLHGEDHRLPFGRSAEELTASLSRARQELEALAGQSVTLYRPSHGFKNVALLRALRRVGLKAVFWDYGVWDTDAPPRETLLARLRIVTPTQSATRSRVVLLHDGRGDFPEKPAHAEALLSALRTWL